MLPLRYAGVWHALKLITQEEGIRGIFRGYMAFSVSVNVFYPYHFLTDVYFVLEPDYGINHC